jgi:hypothetical protein
LPENPVDFSRIDGLFEACDASNHDDRRADTYAGVEIDDILIHHADAAGRNGLADGMRLVGAVDAVKRGAEIEGAGANPAIPVSW